MSTTLGGPRPDAASYMMRAAASAAGRSYKQELMELLDVQLGQTVLDVGCGPGTDLPTLAECVGVSGTVIGVDRNPVMLAEARRRTSDLAAVQIREADVHALPVEPGTVDRAKVDRVLMHVTDPVAVLEQVHLATRPGARIGLAEPDWDTLVVDAEDLDTSRAFTRYTASKVVRHATIGRSLARYAQRAGFAIETVRATTPVFLDFQDADHTLGLGRNVQKAIQDGCIDEVRGRRWFTSLCEKPFFASFTLATVICSR
ncbi:methyltransferase domain-containing protein [Streptomyces sp. NPDC048231]|uniref:methyltransferase domain-containing protein n=1 Tax=Streptomyces sp. NPDC048231 TaxID=3365519 RepID=UPI00371DD704